MEQNLKWRYAVRTYHTVALKTVGQVLSNSFLMTMRLLLIYRIYRSQVQNVESIFCIPLAQTHDFRENAIKSMTGATGRQRVSVSVLMITFCQTPVKRYLINLNLQSRPYLEKSRIFRRKTPISAKLVVSSYPNSSPARLTYLSLTLTLTECN